MSEPNSTPTHDSGPETGVQNAPSGTRGRTAADARLATPAKSGRKHKMGRPRVITPKVYSKEMLAEIDRMARAQCKDKCIASALGFDDETFRADLHKRTEQQRAIGKIEILKAQYDEANTTRNPTMLIWFGKQHLEQADKADVKQGVTISTFLQFMQHAGATPVDAGGDNPNGNTNSDANASAAECRQ